MLRAVEWTTPALPCVSILVTLTARHAAYTSTPHLLVMANRVNLTLPPFWADNVALHGRKHSESVAAAVRAEDQARESAVNAVRRDHRGVGGADRRGEHLAVGGAQGVAGRLCNRRRLDLLLPLEVRRQGPLLQDQCSKALQLAGKLVTRWWYLGSHWCTAHKM